MGFSLSVHNTVVGLYSLIFQNKLSYTALAANENTFTAGLIEALVTLREKRNVLLVFADESIPELYRDTFPFCSYPFAVAFLLELDGNLIFWKNPDSLGVSNLSDDEIDVLRFLRWFLRSHESFVLNPDLWSIKCIE